MLYCIVAQIPVFKFQMVSGYSTLFQCFTHYTIMAKLKNTCSRLTIHSESLPVELEWLMRGIDGHRNWSHCSYSRLQGQFSWRQVHMSCGFHSIAAWRSINAARSLLHTSKIYTIYIRWFKYNSLTTNTPHQHHRYS